MSSASTVARGPGRSRRMVIVLLSAIAFLLGTTVVLVVRHEDSQTSTTMLQGSGIAASEKRTVPAFSSVELAGANDVSVRIGDEQSGVVHADDNLIDRVTTEVRDGRLVIDNRGNWTTASPMSVAVVVSVLDSLTLSGSGTIDVDGVHAEALRVSLEGSGTISARGTVDGLHASLAGAGNLLLGELRAPDVVAALNGTGLIDVHASASLDASIAGTGTIMYAGQPDRVDQSVTGTGSVVGR